MILFLMLVVGGTVIAMGVFQQKEQNALRRACTAQTPGVVATIEEVVWKETYRENNRDKIRSMSAYMPTYEYSVEGTQLAKVGQRISGKLKLRVGDAVTVFYDPEKPETCYILEEKAGTNIGIYGIIFGAAIVIFGIAAQLMN